MDPRLSIIVPVFKVEDYLEQCIESILNQPFIDFELILVDDGSPDNCGKICDSYSLNDNRIRVIHKKNGGLSSARNVAIEVARGKYLSFIDSDDFISNDFYQDNMEYLMTHPDTDMLVLQVCHYDNKINKLIYNEKRELIGYNEIVNYMFSENYLGSAWINIYNKEIFNHLRYPEGQIFEDGFILPEIVEKTKKIFITNTGIYYYRKRDDSIMQEKKTIKSWCDILSTHVKQLDYCCTIPDNKKIFIEKYKICYLALIYAFIEYPNGPFKEYLGKFQSYDYKLSQLLRDNLGFKYVFILYFLKKIGFITVIKIYKLLNIYKT